MNAAAKQVAAVRECPGPICQISSVPCIRVLLLLGDIETSASRVAELQPTLQKGNVVLEYRSKVWSRLGGVAHLAISGHGPASRT